MAKNIHTSEFDDIEDNSKTGCTPSPLLTSLSSQNDLIPTFVADQTPTPTRFLKTCEDEGLFSLISEETNPVRNPFDDAFRRAAQCEEERRKTHRTPVLASAEEEDCEVEEMRRDYREESVSVDRKLLIQRQEERHLVSTSASANSQDSLRAEEIRPEPAAAAAVLVESTAAEQQLDQQFVTVLLRLADGSLAPINLPVETLRQATHTSPSVNLTFSHTESSMSHQHVEAPSLIPLPVISHPTPQHPIPHSQKETESLRSDVRTCDDSMIPDIAHVTQHRHQHTEHVLKRPSNIQIKSEEGSEEGEIRKKQALECNRAAASRSRNKRKVWINNLEAKTSELQRINKQLTIETNNLREEITMLKRALDDHQDCSPSYPNYTSHHNST